MIYAEFFSWRITKLPCDIQNRLSVELVVASPPSYPLYHLASTVIGTSAAKCRDSLLLYFDCFQRYDIIKYFHWYVCYVCFVVDRWYIHFVVCFAFEFFFRI